MDENLPIGSMDPIEFPDDSWWESIISDEIQFISPISDALSVKNSGDKQMNGKPDIDWVHIQQLFKNEKIVTVAVTGYNQGGVLVKGDRLEGFIPSSHLMHIAPINKQNDKKRMLAGMLGKHLSVKVIECDPVKKRVILSERAAQVNKGSRADLLKSLTPGDRVTGLVTNITNFGVFIDLGGLEGLVHVSELSWGRVTHLGDLVKIGQQIELMVLQTSADKLHVALSLKRLLPNPWDDLVQKCKPGDIFPAVITHITGFGAFARLEDFGIEGLIHQTSLHLADSKRDIHEILKVNQSINVIIVHIDHQKHRLGLNLIN